jgi:succinate dehydrogenase cytochrome b subunit
LQRAKIGGGKGIRTPDLLIANETLYQLSYTPPEMRAHVNRKAGFFNGARQNADLLYTGATFQTIQSAPLVIAISYRREDSLPIAGRLYDRLQAKFGKQNVFMDFDSIPPGADFREHIKRTIERSNVVIAVIGPRWLGEQSDSLRRIDEPTDFVRLEIKYALERGVPIIPLLIDNTLMPRPEKLPLELEALAFRNALPLDSGIDFHNHAERLINGICSLYDVSGLKGASASGSGLTLAGAGSSPSPPSDQGLNFATQQIAQSSLHRSPVAKKKIVAVTGVVLVAFIIGHLLNNLQIFLGPDWVNSYAQRLRELGPLRWIIRISLLVSLLLHIFYTASLAIENRRARLVPNKKNGDAKIAVASRSGAVSGLMALTFIFYHLAHFTFRVTDPRFLLLKTDPLGRDDVYTMVVYGFQNIFVSAFYVLGMFFLALHLNGRLSAFFQWFTSKGESMSPRLAMAGRILAWLIFAGYTSVPIAVLLQLVKPDQQL